METCLVFPRLICKSQWGVGVPAFSGHRFKKLLHILRCQHANFPAAESAWRKQWGTKGEQGEARKCVSAVISGAAKIGLSYKDLRGAALWSGGWHPRIPSGKYSCH